RIVRGEIRIVGAPAAPARAVFDRLPAAVRAHESDPALAKARCSGRAAATDRARVVGVIEALPRRVARRDACRACRAPCSARSPARAYTPGAGFAALNPTAAAPACA